MTLRYLGVGSLICILVLSGCSDGTPSESPGDAPTAAEQTDAPSIQDTVTEIVELRNKIRDGFAAEDIDAAHGPLHDVGSKLNELSDLVGKTGLSDGDKQAIEGHINTLFAAFGEVDKTLHGQEGSTYEEEANTIDEATEKLVTACKGL